MVCTVSWSWKILAAPHIQDNCQQWRCRELDTCREHRPSLLSVTQVVSQSLTQGMKIRWAFSLKRLNRRLNQVKNWVRREPNLWLVPEIDFGGILSNNTGPVTVITRMNIHWYYLANRCLHPNEKWWKFNKNVDDKVLICISPHIRIRCLFARAWVLMSHSWLGMRQHSCNPGSSDSILADRQDDMGPNVI